MKKFKKYALFGFLWVVFFSLMMSPGSFAAEDQGAFRAGERIKFGVYSSGIRTGSGELVYHGLKDRGSGMFQHIAFNVTTLSVRDQDIIYGTSDFGYPVRVERKVRLFGRDEEIIENYAPDHRSVALKKSVHGKEVPDQVIESDEGLGNVLLLLYNLRNDKELKIGQVYKIVLPTQKFDLRVKDRRRLKTPLGVFDAFYLESQPAKYRIWMSSREDRLPLRIQGLIAGGMMYLLATEVSYS
jgi:hypothetical protein